jgi:sugar/nucleoside kinase (ribokinase family)
MKPILVVGETNVDVVLRGAVPALGKEVLADDCALTLGSASAICAMGLARLGNAVVFVSRVGADLWGDYCLGLLNSAGIDTSHVTRDPALKTGVTVSITSSSDRALVTYIGSIAAVTEADVPDPLLERARHLHVSSFFLQSGLRAGCGRLFARARQRALTTSLDPGFDPKERWDTDLAELLPSVDLFLPNEFELAAIAACAEPGAALLALENGRTRTVVKLGRRGAMSRERGETIYVPAFAMEPIDTTGAGDSFNAGFLHAFVRGRPIRECLRFGNAAGALSTRALGGTNGQPTIDELMSVVGTGPERG